MKTRFIKTVSAVLCLVLVLSTVLPLTASAMSISEGTDMLRTLWSRGNGPIKDGFDIDYSYYSPVENGADASKKYPLVIIMAGALEGSAVGYELHANEMPKWTAEEFQQRFTNGAAYLFIARAPEEDDRYWDYIGLTPALKAAIDDFCEKNPNVDTERIYAIGWCLGGTGVINLAAAYPDDFAAIIIMSYSRSIMLTEALRLKNTPVWIMGGIADTYALYSKNIQPSFDILRSVSNRKDALRLTSYLKIPDVYLVPDMPFILGHDTWDNLAEDLHYEGEGSYAGGKYYGEYTIDGNGKKIDDPYAISWLCSHTTADRPGSTANEGDNLKFIKFIEKLIINFNDNIKNPIRIKFMDFLLDIYRKMGLLEG